MPAVDLCSCRLVGLAAFVALGCGCGSPRPSSTGTGTSGSTGGGSSGTGRSGSSGAGSRSSTGQPPRGTTTGGSGGGTTTSRGSTGASASGGSTDRPATSSSGSSSSGSSSGGELDGGEADAGADGGGFDPGQPGPYAVGTTLNLSETFAGQSVPLDLYYPTAPDGGALDLGDGGVPEVVVSHGWLDNKSSFAGWGQHLASWGFAVAVPSWTNGMYYTNAPANAASIVALLAWMDSEGAADPASPLYRLADGERHGLVGHSFGGLTVYLVASQDPTVQAVVGLDPVDDPSGSAAAAVPKIAGLGAMLPAQPALCDTFGSDQATVYANFPGQKLYAQVANAIHCDCQDPAGGCQSTCGPADPIRQMHFQRYATAALLWAFSCDSRALTWLDGAAIAADTGLSSQQSASIACVPAP
ncbi:MAG: alpha/beta fold hydrolase [Myxococcales bacterium]